MGGAADFAIDRSAWVDAVPLADAVFGRVGSGVSDVTDAVLLMMVPAGVDAGTVP